MEQSSFFNSINHDRKYSAVKFAEYFSSFIGNGVFAVGSNLQVLSNNNMNITIRQGKAWINGYYYNNTTDLILNVELADGALYRRDSVVLRLDYLKREIRAYIKKGVCAASNPVAAEIKRDSDIYELKIAEIIVNKGIITVRQQDIVDTRMNATACGLVHAVIDKIDSTVIFNQFKAWYADRQQDYSKNIENWTSERQKNFENWTSEKQKNFEVWTKNKEDLHEKWTSEKQAAFVKWYSNIVESWEDNLKSFFEDKNTEFATWFNIIKEKLSVEIATKISAEILTENVASLNNDKLQKVVNANLVADGFAQDVFVRGCTINNIIDYKKARAIGTGDPTILIDGVGFKIQPQKAGSCVAYIPTEMELKHNTQYTIFFAIDTQSNVLNSVSVGFKMDSNWNLGGAVFIHGLNPLAGITFTTPAGTEEISGIFLGCHDASIMNVSNYIYARNLMIFEGDLTGDKAPLEYVSTGLHSLGERGGFALTSKNRNNLIIDDSNIFSKSNNVYTNITNTFVTVGTTSAVDKYENVAFSLTLKPNTRYKITGRRVLNLGNKNCAITVKSKEDSFNYFESTDDNINGIFTTRNETAFRFHIYCTLENIGRAQVEYEAIEIAEESKWNGQFTPNAHDEIKVDYELRKGDEFYSNKIYKRSGKATFNGDENWFFVNSAKQYSDTLIFALEGVSGKQGTEDETVMCNRFNNRHILDQNREGCFINWNGALFVRIYKNKLKGTDISHFKAWLKDNPIEIVYMTGSLENIYQDFKQDLAVFRDGTIYLHDPCHNYFSMRVPKTVLSGIQSIVKQSINTQNNTVKNQNALSDFDGRLEVTTKDIASVKGSVDNLKAEVNKDKINITTISNSITAINKNVATNVTNIGANKKSIDILNIEIKSMKDKASVFKEDAQTLITQLVDSSRLIIKAQQTALSKYSMPSGKSVYFENAFPNECLQVIATGNYDATTSIEYHGLENISVFDVTKNGFSFNGNGVTDKWYSIRWIAIGY